MNDRKHLAWLLDFVYFLRRFQKMFRWLRRLRKERSVRVCPSVCALVRLCVFVCLCVFLLLQMSVFFNHRLASSALLSRIDLSPTSTRKHIDVKAH